VRCSACIADPLMSNMVQVPLHNRVLTLKSFMFYRCLLRLCPHTQWGNNNHHRQSPLQVEGISLRCCLLPRGDCSLTPSMVLQPLLGFGLPQKMPPSSVFCSSHNTGITTQASCSPQHNTLHLSLGGPLPMLAIYRRFALCDIDAKGWILERSQIGKLDLLSVKSKL